MKRRIYVATSWRNPYQPAIVASLRAEGHEVYDFRNPIGGDAGFSWREIDDAWMSWTPQQYIEALQHPAARRGFNFDMDALIHCDACVMLQPCGRSASLELGFAVAAGKDTCVLLARGQEPELMLKMADRLFVDLREMIDWVGNVVPREPAAPVYMRRDLLVEGLERAVRTPGRLGP